MWTVKQMAEQAKQTPSYIRRLLRAGFIKGERPGRDWIISDEEAKRYLTHIQDKK